jgi:hypothetical protein
VLLWAVPAASAADRVGDGEEADVPAVDRVRDPVTPLRPMAPQGEEPAAAVLAPVSPLSPAEPKAALPRPARQGDAVASPAQPVLRPPAYPPLSRGGEQSTPPAGDLTGDKPGVSARRTDSPFRAELEDFPGEANLNPKAQKVCQLLADLKKEVLQISADLDAGGRESTRLIHTTETLGRDITTLAGVWPGDAAFRDACSSSKRTAVVLEEELRREPRHWSHVRWAFRDVQDHVQALRRLAAGRMGGEPRLVRTVQKGKEVYVEAPKDPEILRRELEERRRREAREEADRLRKRQEPEKKLGEGD